MQISAELHEVLDVIDVGEVDLQACEENCDLHLMRMLPSNQASLEHGAPASNFGFGTLQIS